MEDHRAWAHPGASKRQEIMTGYPSLFPCDKATRKAIMELRCPECNLTRGTRTYRKTKRMKEKEKKAAVKARKRAKKTSSSTASPSTPPSASLSDG
eukprot:2680236-Rhodomonas_salina.1